MKARSLPAPEVIATSPSFDKPKLDPELLKTLHSLDRHPLRLPVFVVLYLLAAIAAIGGTRAIAAPWNYLICFPFYLLTAASLHGISLFTHEGVHGVLSRHPGWNRGLSMLCALPVLQNYAAYKVLHLQHHAHLGMTGDPDHYKNYTRWNWLVFLMHWGRLLFGYPVYITLIPILGFRQGNTQDRVWIVLEVAIAILLITAVCLSPLPPFWILHGWVLPMLLINTIVNIRGMSQHTLLEQEADVVRGTRTILSNPITRFFMCNENYHLEHHLYPGVPWYHLPRLHQALQGDLIARQAPFIDDYVTFVRDFVVASFRGTTVGSITIHR